MIDKMTDNRPDQQTDGQILSKIIHMQLKLC